MRKRTPLLIINDKTYKKKATSDSNTGYCIRCANPIKLNPMAPYCKDCYRIWNKYKDEEYPEKYCHICGIEKETTKIKPTCYLCYKANKNKLDFGI